MSGRDSQKTDRQHERAFIFATSKSNRPDGSERRRHESEIAGITQLFPMKLIKVEFISDQICDRADL